MTLIGQQILILAVGVGLILFINPLAKFIVLAQNKLWGLKLGEKEVLGSKVMLLFGGLFLIGTTLFALLTSRN